MTQIKREEYLERIEQFTEFESEAALFFSICEICGICGCLLLGRVRPTECNPFRVDSFLVMRTQGTTACLATLRRTLGFGVQRFQRKDFLVIACRL
jgi:hypothetical protein